MADPGERAAWSPITGSLDYYQRQAAGDDASQIAGVKDVANLITVTPPGAIAAEGELPCTPDPLYLPGRIAPAPASV